MRHLALALVAGALAVGASAQTDDHGDDRASATRVALPSETSGEIAPGGDEDWFRFEVATSGDVVVETSGVLDTIGALHDANGDVLVVDDDSGGAFNFSIQRTLEAGTYYVRVTSFESNTGGYVLHLRTGAPDDDHGDTPASATQVALPSETAGEIDPGGDWDFFRFEVAAAGGEVTAETTGDDLDTVGFLFDADGNLLASNDDADPGSNLNFRIQQTLDAGTYYVLVVSFGGAVGSYVLSMRRGEAEEDAHGDSLATATRVALPSRTAGAIGAGDDRDWFRFEVPVAGVVTASTLGGLDTIGGLYDANGTLLASNNDAVDNFGNFRIRHAVGAGTHYVRVWSGFQETGSYVLDLRQEGSDDDHGNSAADATAVALPGNVSGHIDPAGDADWFRFEAARAGTLTVRARVTGGDLRFLLVLAEWSYSGPTEVDWELSIEAGVHYLEVKHDSLSYNDGTGDYTIELLFDGVGAPTTDPATADPASAAAGHLRNLGDFNGDGRDDVLLRHADGRWHYYPMDGANVLAGGGAANLTRDLAWRIAGIGDFDGDGKDDVLLRNTDGRWFFYPMDGRNVLAGRGTVRMTPDLAWQVAGIGDLDGDGKDDVLMRHEDGRWHYYRMNGRRPLAGSGSGRLTRDLNWQMAGVGDFDGDGKDDVLLRRRDDGRWYFYPMDGRASIAGRGTVPLTRDLAWAVAGVGDFDADGRHDVLLRHADGRWRYYPLQGRRVLDGAGLVNLTDDTSATVAGIGDLNYDGCADVLARLANGGWQYYALDGRRVLAASGEAALSGDLAWGALSAGGVATGVAPTVGTTLTDRSVTLGRNETVDLAKAFVDDQTLTYEARSSNAGVVRANVDGDALTLTPVAEGTATVTVTARDPDGNTATQTFAVTVAESGGGDGGGRVDGGTDVNLVAVATGSSATSDDGTRWEVESYPLVLAGSPSLGLYGSTSVTYGDGRWVAVGLGVITVSEDGRNWTAVVDVDPLDDESDYSSLASVAYGNGRWVAVGSNAIVTSTDGQNWSAVYGLDDTIPGVRYGGGLWIVYGGETSLLASYDGLDWTEIKISDLTANDDLGFYQGAGICLETYRDGLWYGWTFHNDSTGYNPSWSGCSRTYGGSASVVGAALECRGCEICRGCDHYGPSFNPYRSSAEFADGHWVVVAYDGIAVWEEGAAEWHFIDLPPLEVHDWSEHAVVYRNGTWVASTHAGLYYNAGDPKLSSDWVLSQADGDIVNPPFRPNGIAAKP